MNRQRFDAAATADGAMGIISEGYAIMYPQAVKELCRQEIIPTKAFLNWADKQELSRQTARTRQS